MSLPTDLHLRHRPADEGAPVLLLIHGLGESGLCFEGLLAEDRLAGWRLLCPDLPGYGRSPWPETPLSIPELAETVVGWLDSQGVERAVVLGHSMGGVIGQEICERFGDRVSAFVNVEGNLTVGDCGFSKPISEIPLGTFLESGYREILAGLEKDGATDPALAGYLQSMRLCDPRALHHNSGELVEVSAKEDLPQRFAALETPKLYLGGRPRGVAPRSQELLAAATGDFAWVDESGHWPYLDQHEEFMERLIGLLTTLD